MDLILRKSTLAKNNLNFANCQKNIIQNYMQKFFSMKPITAVLET